MFTYSTVVQMHQTDAAGILFFSKQCDMMHDAYQAMMSQKGLSFPDVLKHKDFFMPIVHVESDYKASVFVGDPLSVEVSLISLGQTSFTLGYEIKLEQKTVGLGKTVHVSIDRGTKKKISLPEELVNALKKI